MDIDQLTLGEVAKVEELSGISINAFGGENTPQGKALAALAFVIKKREDPKYTFNDALNLTIDQVNEVIGVTDELDAATDPKDK